MGLGHNARLDANCRSIKIFCLERSAIITADPLQCRFQIDSFPFRQMRLKSRHIDRMIRVRPIYSRGEPLYGQVIAFEAPLYSIRHKKVIEWVKAKLIKLVFVPSEENISDIFTKASRRAVFLQNRDVFMSRVQLANEPTIIENVSCLTMREGLSNPQVSNLPFLQWPSSR